MATKKSTAAKPAGAAEAKPEPAAEPSETVSVAVDKAPSLKIKDLVASVSEATGGKKKDVKLVVEATLKALGDAMGAGLDMNLPGFGRSRITRTAEKDGAAHLTLKVKRGPHRAKHAEEPLAEDGEDS